MSNIDVSYIPIIISTLLVFGGLIGLYVKVDKFMENKMKKPLEDLRLDSQCISTEVQSLKETSKELKMTSDELKQTAVNNDKGITVVSTQLGSMQDQLNRYENNNSESHNRIYRRLEKVENDVGILKSNK